MNVPAILREAAEKFLKLTIDGGRASVNAAALLAAWAVIDAAIGCHYDFVAK
jgi:hypothetical protein